SWVATPVTGAPSTYFHKAVWTGSSMIVIGYVHGAGARYDPSAGQWQAVATTGRPALRGDSVVLWTGDMMIVWSGAYYGGARYVPPSSTADDDGDGVRLCEGDCDDGDAAVWATPGEVPSLDMLGDTATLAWSAPSFVGGTTVVYDTIRTTSASDFAGAATCVESGDGTDTVATDLEVPSPGAVVYYLVRARNACPGAMGLGSPGTQSDGTPRAARSCP